MKQRVSFTSRSSCDSPSKDEWTGLLVILPWLAVLVLQAVRICQITSRRWALLGTQKPVRVRRVAGKGARMCLEVSWCSSSSEFGPLEVQCWIILFWITLIPFNYWFKELFLCYIHGTKIAKEPSLGFIRQGLSPFWLHVVARPFKLVSFCLRFWPFRRLASWLACSKVCCKTSIKSRGPTLAWNGGISNDRCHLFVWKRENTPIRSTHDPLTFLQLLAGISSEGRNPSEHFHAILFHYAGWKLFVPGTGIWKCTPKFPVAPGNDIAGIPSPVVIGSLSNFWPCRPESFQGSIWHVKVVERSENGFSSAD